MAEVISFDGSRKRVSVQPQPPQVAERKRNKVVVIQNPSTAPRILRNYYLLRQSVEHIARLEGCGRLRVQAILRENSVPVWPGRPVACAKRAA